MPAVAIQIMERAPASTLLKTSRPFSSVPSQYVELGELYWSWMWYSVGGNGVIHGPMIASTTWTATTASPIRPVLVRSTSVKKAITPFHDFRYHGS